MVDVGQVRRLLPSAYEVEEVDVHYYNPKDFLINFHTTQEMEHVLRSPNPPTAPFRLVFKRWRRELLAAAEPLQY